MATVETGGAGGKFRKKPIRRSQATPYDRPPTALRPTLLDSGQRANNNGWLSKLVDPASRLITAGAHKFFSSVFRKRILPPPDDTRESGEMQREISPMVAHSDSKEPIGRDNDPTKVPTSGEVAELEDIFKQKTFTRSEIDHLTTLLLSRAVDSSVEVDKGRSNPIFSDEEAVHNSSEIVASFPTLEKGAERVAISTPAVISKVVEDVASPAELAKAYMGSRSSRASPSISLLQNEILREDLSTPNNSFLQRKSQANSLIQKHTSDIGASSNGFMTPQLRGRSAIYNMASTPFSRPRPTQTLEAAKTDLKVHGASSSYNITETQQLSGSKRQVLKRRSSVLESDIGFVGPIRRIRQKPSLLHHKTLSLPPAGAAHVKHVSERLTDVDKLPYNHFSSKALPDTGVRSKSNGYVPSQSIKTAEKIFEHLDKITSKGMSPEKKIDIVGGSSPVQKASDICDVSPHKSSSTVDSLNVLKTNDSSKESGLFESNVNALDRSPKISQRVNEGSLKRFSFVEDAAEAVSLKKSMENVNPESSSDDQQKKLKFQMSAHEDYLKLDKVNAVDGACTPINKVVESHALAERSVGMSFNAPESAKSSAGRPPAPETNPSSNLLCTNIEVSLPDGSAATQKSTAFSFPVASSSSSATNHSTQEAVCSPLLAVAGDKTAIQSGKINEITAFSSNGANFAPHLFSPSSIVQSASVKDMKTELPSSASGAVAKTDERDRTDKNISFDASKKMDTPSFAVGFAKGSISSGVLSNGALVSNGLPSAPMPMGASSPIQVSSTSNDQSPVPVSAPAPFSFSNGNALFTSIAASTAGTPITSNLSTFGSSTNHLSSSTTAAPALFESSFQSGFTAVSSISSTVVTTAFESASKSGAASNDTAFGNATSGLFTAKPSVTASVGNAGSVFSASTFKPASSTTQNSGPVSNGFTFTPQATASTVAVTTSASASSPLFGSSGSVGFNASVSTFSNPFTSSSTSGSSVSSSSTVTAPISSSNMFGWQSPNPTAPFGTSQSTGFTFGLKAPGTSSATNSTPIVFGATPTSSTASKTAPFVFGSSSSAASIFSSPSPAIPTSTAPTTPFPSQPTFGSSTPQPFSFSSTPVGNNDQMSMDHSMSEDSVQVSTPTAPVFGAPISAPSSGFVFGGAAPAPSTASPFQFGGQQNQFGPQNTPFQPSGSIELNNGGAGSFSLGSGGVDSKANRRIIKVKNRIRKK